LHQFTYHRASTLHDAVERLAEPSALPLGGGTDLLVLLKEELAAPTQLVDVRGLPGAREISSHAGGLRIGAAARVNDLVRNDLVCRDFPSLASACASVGTTALRHMGTIAGNICQRPRCWYFRRNIPCLKNGGEACPARDGENQYHAILGGGPCFIVQPSDPAVVLTALEANVETNSRAGDRSVPIAQFYALPTQRPDRETVLETGELVTAIEIPSASAGGWQRYDKLMQRGSWDFSLVSLAAVRRADGEVRLVLGGVAHKPWRVSSSIEEDVASGGLSDEDIATLADRALYDARPLTKNGYKLDLAAALIRRAITDMLAED
jgi:xanthine dehydrogenase YagS FAD-binding subunit